MVKSYLKIEQARSFGLITSANSNSIWCASEGVGGNTLRTTNSGRAVSSADEDVLVWDIKTGELLSRWSDPSNKAQVTVVTRSGVDKDVFAAGYADGTIRIWDSKISTLVVTFNGHKSAVTKLVFDNDGVKLASGSRDTDIIIWDLISETGLFKLRGHKDAITGLEFVSQRSLEGLSDVSGGLEDSVVAGEAQASHFLISTSKDALIKVWDIVGQHCLETHVAQSNGECWSMCMSPDGTGIVTAGNDGELRVWGLDLIKLVKVISSTIEDVQGFLKPRGSLYRQGKDRTSGVAFHPTHNYLLAHGTEKAVEIWKLRSEGEVKKLLARKRKRRREKNAVANGSTEAEVEVEEAENVDDITAAELTDIITTHVIVRTGGKVKSVSWAIPGSSKGLFLLVSESNNQLELWNIEADHKRKSSGAPTYTLASSVDLAGHRSDIRALALSSDDRMLASASNGSLKIWNTRTKTCLRTLECGYALCVSFLPGDKIVIVGNRSGDLEIFDISSSSLIDTVKAHEGPIWTMHVHPDGKSIATGSADKSAKLYNFTVVQEEIPGTRRTSAKFKLIHSRTLKVADDILSLRFSPDGRLLATGLLDNTVKVFFVDTLKLFLNLYGHKLPVLSLDISFDSKMIVTCSADKNVRLWGLDFGDCHKAIFAHQDSIMQVAFVPINDDGNGHNFFSASKDRSIKYWDGKKFEQVQKLAGHHGEIWALAVGHTGTMVVSASHDKSIRVWEQTDEQIFLEEEREKEMEELYESTLVASLEPDREQGEQAESGMASKQTSETLMSGEKIMEALTLGAEDHELMEAYRAAKLIEPQTAQPARNPIYLAYNNISAEAYLLTTIQKIKSASLQDALLVLPFSQLAILFTFLGIWADRQWNIPLTCRILFFMLKTHHHQIIASKPMRTLLDGIRIGLRKSLTAQKDEIGYNLAGLQYISRRVEDASQSTFIDEDADESVDPTKGKKKRAFLAIG